MGLLNQKDALQKKAKFASQLITNKTLLKSRAKIKTGCGGQVV